jgi:hypothetical protein
MGHDDDQMADRFASSEKRAGPNTVTRWPNSDRRPVIPAKWVVLALWQKGTEPRFYGLDRQIAVAGKGACGRRSRYRPATGERLAGAEMNRPQKLMPDLR